MKMFVLHIGKFF